MEKYSPTSVYFCCPVCRRALEVSGGGWSCPAGHRFDVSREGYVNLLVGRGGGTHGDNREMIRARRRFLERGHYLPLRLLLSSRIGEQRPAAILDAGCGEGWYTAGAASALPDAAILAVDVSKDAAALCAKRLGARAKTAVASVYDLPLPDGSVDAVLSVFSPFVREEFLRVLAPGGRLYMAAPGARHLWQLKELLYDEPYENELHGRRIPGFELLKEDEIHYTRDLEGDELRDLFAMTPYFYRTPEAGRARAEKCAALRVEIAFHAFTYKKIEKQS